MLDVYGGGMSDLVMAISPMAISPGRGASRQSPRANGMLDKSGSGGKLQAEGFVVLERQADGGEEFLF